MEKLWGVWELEEKIGSGSFGTVYKAKKEELGKTFYSAIKHISLPKNEDELDELKREGTIISTESIKEYYKDTIDELVKEIEIMYELRANPNIVDYQDHLIIEKENNLGFDIYIRMELLTPLDKYLEKYPIDEEVVTKIGIHLCNALEVCKKHNLIHRDIKPANIFVSEDGIFKLGDFGVAKKLEKTTFNMSKKGTFNYMSPEIYKGKQADLRCDIYSLGIVMYRMLNNNRAPFIDKDVKVIKASDNENALMRRMNGELFPNIEGINSSLLTVINTACSFAKENRYQNPQDMKNDLEKIEKNEEKNFSSFYDKTVSIYGENEKQEETDFDKTVSIYDENAENKTNTKKSEEVKEIPSNSTSLVEDLLSGTSGNVTDEELRKKIVEIIQEERNGKFVNVDVGKEKVKKINPIISFIVSAVMAIILLLTFRKDKFIYSKSRILFFSEIEIELIFLGIVCFMILLAFLISLGGKNFTQKSKKIYLANMIILAILPISLYNKAIKINIGYIAFFIGNLFLLFNPYNWNLIFEKQKVNEKMTNSIKRRNKILEKEYDKKKNKKSYIVEIVISVIIFIELLVVCNFKFINQSNPDDTSKLMILIKNNYIKIRESEDKHSDVVGRVYKDEKFIVIKRNEHSGYTSFEIETEQGVHGFLNLTDDNQDYIEIINKELLNQSNKNLSTLYITVNAEYANIRKTNNINSEVIGKVYKGEQFNVLGYNYDNKFETYLITTEQGIHGYVKNQHGQKNVYEKQQPNYSQNPKIMITKECLEVYSADKFGTSIATVYKDEVYDIIEKREDIGGHINYKILTKRGNEAWVRTSVTPTGRSNAIEIGG